MLMWDSGNMIGLTDILIHSTQNKLTILKKKNIVFMDEV